MRERRACERCRHIRLVPNELSWPSSFRRDLLGQPLRQVASGLEVVECRRQFSSVDVFVIEQRIADGEDRSSAEFCHRHDYVAFVLKDRPGGRREAEGGDFLQIKSPSRLENRTSR